MNKALEPRGFDFTNVKSCNDSKRNDVSHFESVR